LHADDNYDYRRCRADLARHGIKVRIAPRRIEGGHPPADAYPPVHYP
jgi:hypothetical protein